MTQGLEPLAIRFANTIYADRQGIHDGIATNEALVAWLRDHEAGLADRRGPVARLGDRDRRMFAAVRDAIRAIATEHTGGPPAPENATDVLNAAVEAAPSWPRLHRDRRAWWTTIESAAPPAAVALADIARSAMEVLATAGDRLGACRAPGCVLFFVRDHPRRNWCSDGCGNRARQARHAQRQRAQRPR